MSTKRRLPVLEQAALESFTLYRNNRHLVVDFPAGVFCLAGANGLGKSTFLAAVNFGLTGIVADPERKYRSVREYFEDSLTYSANYFEGRVDELDRPAAQVTVRFRVGSKRFYLIRNLFEPQALRGLRIESLDGEVVVDGAELDSSEQRHQIYREHLTAECLLSNFEQFVFLQHFLLTFDERRHLLFWDSIVVDPVLYLAFGLDAEDAFKADELRRKMDKAESNARNAQWQATQARNRLKDLGPVAESTDETHDLLKQHQTLTSTVDAVNDRYEAVRKRREDSLLALAEASASYETARSEYDSEFNQRLQGPYDPSASPVVQATLTKGRCEVCGTGGVQALDAVRAALEKSHCPLCDSEIHVSERTDYKRLKEIDLRLEEYQRRLASLRETLSRQAHELEELSDNCRVHEENLREFEQENSSRLPRSGSTADSVDRQRDSLEDERADAIRRRDEHRRRRDAYRAQLEPLQNQLSVAYRDAELEFVPKFRNLAKQFIGLDLDIYLERKGSSSFSLTLWLQGSRRRATTELSESQRFFLDIALRMSLAQHMSDPGSQAALFVDTPEGSLDIAYEARAGTMFAEFSRSGHQLVMTANINASQLLIRLAEQCGPTLMQLVRMTDWTPLSEVQAEGEELFDRAYSDIEAALIAS